MKFSDTAEEQIYCRNDDMHHIEDHFALLTQKNIYKVDEVIQNGEHLILFRTVLLYIFP